MVTVCLVQASQADGLVMRLFRRRWIPYFRFSFLVIDDIDISYAVRRKRETTEERGWIGKLITAKSLGSATTHILMLNHQCPRIRCRIREPAANLLSICLLSCSSRDLQKFAVAFPAYMYSVAKLHKILHIPTLFANYIMDSSEIICLRVQHLFVSYKENIRKGITLNPQACRCQPVGR